MPIEKRTIRYPWRRTALIFCLAGVIGGYYIQRKQLGPWGWSLPLAVIARGLAEYRRKIEIFNDRISYQPAIGSAQTVPFEDITMIELTTLLTGQWTVVVHNLGARVSRKDQAPIDIPLDLPSGRRVFDEINDTWEVFKNHEAREDWKTS